MGPDPVAKYFKTVAENLQTTATPFVDEAKGNLSLNVSSPVFTIPGFVNIPLDQIGIRP